jgi:phosphatidylglycerophosphate synthase
VRDIGKGKTVVQTISVLVALAAHAWPTWHVGGAVLPGTAIAMSALWLMLTVSLLSAFAYFRAFWAEAVRQSRKRRAPLPFVIKRKGDNDVSA